MANITGWGRGTWGQLTFGEPLPVTLSGLAGTSALGTATTVSNNNISVSGYTVTSALGTATVDAKATATLTGVAAITGTPTVNVWGLVDDSQTPSWSTIDDSQTPGWEKVA